MSGTISVIGFDSAWTDNPKSRGAISVLRSAGDGAWQLIEVRPATFSEAKECVERETAFSKLRIVAIDQPTIVPNATGGRPVEKVAASVIGWVGGGVQPASRRKHAMFGDGAPIWRFKDELEVSDDAIAARDATVGTFLIEVFPALSLPSFEPAFCRRLGRPRYNPKGRRFSLGDWQRVALCGRATASAYRVAGAEEWLEARSMLVSPRKTDQDQLDAMLCALIAVVWISGDRSRSIQIGDQQSGYMVALASSAIRDRLTASARRHGVPIDGIAAASR